MKTCGKGVARENSLGGQEKKTTKKPRLKKEPIFNWSPHLDQCVLLSKMKAQCCAAHNSIQY